MEAERKRVANELRSQGAAEAEKIRADADRQREIIVAEAYRDAQKIKGEGDAKAAAIYWPGHGGPESRVLRLLPQPGGLSWQLQATRTTCPGGRAELRFLQVPKNMGRAWQGRQVANDSTLLLAFALMLVIEGIMPFHRARVWRETFRPPHQMSDGQIRFIGLTSMLIGLVMLNVFQ